MQHIRLGEVDIYIPDQGIDLLGLDVVHFLHCHFDLFLVCPDVHDEDKSIVIFNLFYGRLSCQRIFENLVVVKLVPWGP